MIRSHLKAALFAVLIASSASAFQPTIYMGAGVPATGGDGGGGAFTFVASATGTSDSSTTTVATSTTLDLNAGDLIIAYVSHEGTATTISSLTDGGSNSLTFDTGEDVSNTDANLYPLYKTSASNNDTATFTATLGAAREWKGIVVMQYRPSAGTTSKDISGTRENTGSGFGGSTGTFSTTGSYGVACASLDIAASGVWSGEDINSVVADQDVAAGSMNVWCRILSASLSSVTGQTDYSSSSTWAATAIAFKSE